MANTVPVPISSVETQVKELQEWRNKMTVFMNMDYILMTTEAHSLDEYFRRKMSEFQSSVTAVCIESANKMMMDVVRPIEMRMQGSVELLMRDQNSMRSHLAKVNEITN